MIRQCQRCGAPLAPDRKFCIRCGEPVKPERKVTKQKKATTTIETRDQSIRSDRSTPRSQPRDHQSRYQYPPPPPPPQSPHSPPPPPPTTPGTTPDAQQPYPYPPYPYPPHPYAQPPYPYYPYPAYYYPPPSYPGYPQTTYPYPNYPPYPQGYYYPPRKTIDVLRNLASIPVLPSYIFLGIMLLINFIILSIGLGIVTPNLSMNTGTFVIIYPWPNFLFLINLSGGTLIAWYIFLVVAIIMSIVWLIKTEGREFLDIFVKSAKKLHPPPLKFKNSFVMIFQFFFALMFFNVIIIIIIALWGFPGSNPVGEEPELWRLLFDLANASVAEEIFTRTVYIGIPLLIFDFIARRPKNKLHRYFVGGGFKIEHITIFLIIFSSVIFGLAHYPGWGLWKVVPTTAAGLAFGYLFVRKGIHAAIILHFLFDYMAILPFFFLDNMVALGLLSIIIGIMMLFWSTSGLLYFSLIFMKISEFINIRLMGAKPQPQPVGAPAAAYGGADYYGSTQYPYYPPQYPEAAPESQERYCSMCKNKLRYLPYAGSYYCERCMRYEY